MTRLLVFGASTPSGAALLTAASDPASDPAMVAAGVGPVLAVGRRSSQLRADLTEPGSFQPAAGAQLWISFAPIWHLAPFLDSLGRHHPERLQGLKAVVACSSSSRITKRFAANAFDRALVQRLARAEEQLLAACAALGVPCRILAPTLIYGRAGAFRDANLSRLLGLMRRWPLLPVPAAAGLRQPIHASQLAAVALAQALTLARPPSSPAIAASSQPAADPVLPVGGDESLSYRTMLERLQAATPPGDPARRCILVPLPPRLLLALASPLLLVSPKAFEAVQRMHADLAGFPPAHSLLQSSPHPFPVLPLGEP